jgi:rhamnosyl/mannosyltransferase
MVLVEAEMFGKPVISCEIGTGTSFVNAHGETGFVVPPESPQALASAINTLICDTQLTSKLGCGERSRYEKMFSGPALGAAYSRLYDEVLG